MTIAEQLEEKGRAEGRAKGQEEGRVEGMVEGQLEGRRAALRALLAQKFGALTSDDDLAVALGSAGAAQLDAYLARVLTADSLAAVFAE